MFNIIKKQPLNPTVTKMVIDAPLGARKAQAGQFIILRASEDGERIPLTIAGYDREQGTVDIICQIVGGTTMELNELKEGDFVLLCTDGLVNTVSDQEILYEVIHNGETDDCLERLLAISKSRGAADNVTAVLLKQI